MKDTPMDDEVAKAAERLRRLEGGECFLEIYAPRKHGEQWTHMAGQICEKAIIDDRETLARAYLAEHDPTPLTEEWLRSVGFEDIDERKSGLFIASEDGIEVSLGYRGQWLVETAEFGEESEPKTRGDLRRLAMALGIELATK